MTADVVDHPAGPRRHRWGDERKIIVAIDSPDGNERHEKVCQLCKMTCTTVIPPRGFAWREWRTADGMKAQMESTPPCVDSEKQQNVNPEKKRQSP